MTHDDDHDHDDHDSPCIGRRRFLGVALGAAVALPGAGCASAQVRRTFPVVEGIRALSPQERAVLAAVQARLLPSAPFSPGAREIDAVRFLDDMLADKALPAHREARIRGGVVDVEALAAARGAASFVDLDDDAQDALLRALALRAPGRRFLAYLLEPTLEAFLGDPVHGGNPGEVVWRYLGVRAGYPRPSSSEPPAP